jgi:cell division protease FtsH
MGMSDQNGPVCVPAPESDRRMAGVSDSLLDVVDQGVRRIIDECARRAGQLLAENRRRLDDVAEQLLRYETLDEADAYAAADIERVPQS